MENVYSMFTIRPVESWDDISDQMALWRDLHGRLTPENPFTTPFWSKVWFKAHKNDRRQETVMLFSGAKGAEGIILATRKKTQRMKLPVVSIESIGAGRSPNRRHYVYEQEPLLTKASIGPLLQCLAGMKRWTFFRLAPLPQNYPLTSDIIDAAPSYALTALRKRYGVGYRISTTGGWDAYEKSRPKKFRQNIKRACRRLQAAGDFTIVEHGNTDSPNHLIDAIEAVSKNSWKAESGSDILSSSFRGFFENLFLESLASGKLKLWVLYFSGSPIAYEWHFRQDSRLIALKADFDKSYAHFSPGNILAWYALKGSFELGVAEIDYLFGGGDYKQKWATDRYEMEELLLFNSSLYSRFLYKILSRQDWIEFMWRLSDRFGFPKKQKRTNTCEN
jgi:CelD/BcsL family acetyltransferase involved in cellulose biosynthesis